MRGADKVFTWKQADKKRREWQAGGNEVVFTNGCFDLLHSGHVALLEKARALGDKLIVAINSDESVSRIKGPQRPVRNQNERAEILGGLKCVDAVVVFDQDDPLEIITLLEPDVLVKGGDWKPENIIGADVVVGRGKRVEVINLEEGKSTTGLIEKMRKSKAGSKSEYKPKYK